MFDRGSENLEEKGFKLGGFRLVALFLGFVSCIGVARPAFAEGAAPEAESPWAFTLEPYLFAAGISGTVGSDRFPSSVGTSFVDLLEHIKMGAMAATSIRYKRIGILADGNYVKVGGNVALRGSAITGFTDVDVTAKVSFGTGAAFWRFEPTEKLTLNPYLGARWWIIDVPLRFNPDGPRVEPKEVWADFVAGVDLNYDITDRWFVEAVTDVGGGASKVTWQIYGATGYNFKEWLALSAGWRYTGVKHDRDGFLFDAKLSGLLVGFKIRM
jgi:hypothetical protein